MSADLPNDPEDEADRQAIEQIWGRYLRPA